MLVVISHLLVEIAALAPGFGAEWVVHNVGFGRMGVVAFFCISGFVIPFSFKGRTPVRNFVISRFFRLYPAYWLSLATFVIIGSLFGMTFPPVQVLANLTMVQTRLGQPDVINIYWTLFIELVFYGLCTLGFVAGLLNNARAVVAALTLFVAASMTLLVFYLLEIGPDLPPLAIPAYLAIMGFGTLVRQAWLAQDPLARRVVPALAVGLIASLAVVFGLGFADNDPPVHPTADFAGLFLGLGLFAASFNMQALLARPVMVWLGQISYSLYLLHAVCLLICVRIAASVNSDALQIGIILAAVPLSLLVAHLSMRFVEKPTTALGHRIVRGREAAGGE